MSILDKHGACAWCGNSGRVGAPCRTPRCAELAYHFLPVEHVPTNDNTLPDPLIGQMCGDYLVVRHLGSGSFGSVYLGLQLPVGLKAAVKLLNLRDIPDSLRPNVFQKFEAEARALAVVQHPNVVRLLHYGSLRDQPYLVTDFVEHGHTLEDDIFRRAEQSKGYTVQEVSHILGQLLAGLSAVHERGIIHRDIKPGNLMIQDSPGYPQMLKILDFGLAKFLDQGDATYVTSGTPDYMAPEQLTLERLGPWTDLYAVGVIAFEVLTGVKPYLAASLQQTFYFKIDPHFDPLARVAHLDLPESVTEFLGRSLARLGERRYSSAAEMKTDMDKAFEGFDRPSKAPAGVSFERLVTHSVGSSDQATMPRIDSRSYAPAVDSDTAFNRWLEREHERLTRDARKIIKP